MSHVLVTGGTGYIGSHTVVQLLERKYKVTVIDNLSNSNPMVLQRIKAINGTRPTIHQMDLCDLDQLRRCFSELDQVDAVIHFAAKKSVEESVRDPLTYYSNNIVGTLNLLKCCAQFNVRKLVFSSSCTVYGDPSSAVTEDSPLQATNPYGQTKLTIEHMLRDLSRSDTQTAIANRTDVYSRDGYAHDIPYVATPWRIAILRYFNPIGAHPSGLIGEDPRGIPSNLAPYITQVAVGKRDHLQIFGNDYETPDGTCIRDFVHVMDIADGHLNALRYLDSTEQPCAEFNLGTGKGCSVLELLAAFAKAAKKQIPFTFEARRKGDATGIYACVDKARDKLNWVATRTIDQACEDALRWQRLNPNGYDVESAD